MKYLNEIRDLIAGILGLPVELLDPNAEMNQIAEWDSIRNVMILSSLEEKYEVLIPDDDIFDLVSVAAIVEEIKKLKS